MFADEKFSANMYQSDCDSTVTASCRLCLVGIPCVQYPAQGQDSHTHHQSLNNL